MCAPLPVGGTTIGLADRIVDVIVASRRLLSTSDVSRAVNVNPRTVERTLYLLAELGRVRGLTVSQRHLWGATPSTQESSP